MRSSAQSPEPEVSLTKVTNLFVDAAFINQLGVKELTNEEGVCEARVELPAWMGKPQQSLHAVVQASLADHAAKSAVKSVVAPESSVVRLDFKLKYLETATGRTVRAVANVLRCSRSIAVVEVDIYSQGAEVGEEALVAVAEVTLVVEDDVVQFPETHCACLEI
ncbi:PaaI family thioesterase [Verrucomicrobium spinosum]|uniref:PaaI family thioesterase n=1 Tax=Verrucomicrobium spinosum TaxID=2736 RepID=UPI000492A1F3|nr:PaaI family thioesterase [Verrucomicrobium spinosum]